jgi:hypothetical protein
MLCTLSCTSVYYFHICKDLTEGEINKSWNLPPRIQAIWFLSCPYCCGPLRLHSRYFCVWSIYCNETSKVSHCSDMALECLLYFIFCAAGFTCHAYTHRCFCGHRYVSTSAFVSWQLVRLIVIRVKDSTSAFRNYQLLLYEKVCRTELCWKNFPLDLISHSLFQKLFSCIHLLYFVVTSAVF